jgi:hypothetical protein
MTALKSIRRVVFLAALVVLVAAVSAVAAGHGGAVTVEHSPRVCFKASHWGPAPDAVRPCVRITGVEEDGSFSYAVSDADGTVRYTAGVGALDR